MKINILYKFQYRPWGGGNQFLKALKTKFDEMGVYEEVPEKSDVILFNSHHNLKRVYEIKKDNPAKIIIHRIDGPVFLTRGKDKYVDLLIKSINNILADGVIFQSEWTKSKNIEQLNIKSKYVAVIYNAPDKKIFNCESPKIFNLNPNKKIKLIATSWSSNMRKGFGIYKYLDEKLDFSRYEMTFVGNTPIKFKNIKCIKPVASEELANILKQNDIYITASQNDPCSNSLIEALSCGLPAVVLNDGGHPELIKCGGELFESEKDVIEKIEKIVLDYNKYQSLIPNFSLESVANNYYEFIRKIYSKAQKGVYQPKKIDYINKARYYKSKLLFLITKTINKFKK